MVKFFGFVALVFFCKFSARGYPDLMPEAITVYKNPDFYKNLNFGTKINYNQKSAKVPEEGSQANYKYPGETKKPNPPASPGFEVNYDNSPEFHHEPREIFIDTTYKPSKRKGPYSPRYHQENGKHTSNLNAQKPVREKQNEEEEENQESKESGENESVEEPRDFVSVFDENPDEEFKTYHEPILLARPNSDLIQNFGFASSANIRPFHYNKTSPISYDDWKFYTYPKIHANEHLKSEPKLYSEEPPSNSFEDESLSYYGNHDEAEDVSNFFESDEFKNLGADTKHIYKKLLKPKKTFLFKFHSKPKFKKLKFKLKKKHLHNSDWFDEYPFDF